jgi:hypothetical protein
MAQHERRSLSAYKQRLATRLASLGKWLRESGKSLRESLSVSDWVNIVFLTVALVSLYVAVQAYRDAHSSGDKQLAALEASRDSLKTQQTILEQAKVALEASVSNAIAQLDVLQTSLRTSRRQLEVLEAQWKRQLEQPDLHATLVYPNRPAVMFSNSSKVKVATDGYYQLITLNVDHWDHNQYQLVQTKTTPTGNIRPLESYLPQYLELLLSPNKPLEAGNRLFGYFVIECPECAARRVYWLLIKYGQEGWFREVKPTDRYLYPSMSALLALKPATVEPEINHFLNQKDLTRMAERVP